MSDIEINAIFYSKDDVQLAYTLKKACREININVYNIRQFTDMIFRLKDCSNAVLFLDYNSLDNANVVCEFIVNYNINKCMSVVIISEEKPTDINFNTQNFYFIKSTNVYEDLKEIEHSLKINAVFKKNLTECKNNLCEVITEYLLENGFTPQHKGFAYIKECVLYSVNEKGALCALSSDVYPFVASKFNTTPENVERNIRNAISQASKTNFKNKDISKLLVNTKISNKVILGYLVDKSSNDIKKAL